MNCFHSFAIEKKCEFHKNIAKGKDLECLIEKLDGCKSNLEISSTKKVNKHIPSGFSVSTISSFKRIENKHDVFRGKDCMKRFCKTLKKAN